MKYFLLNQDNKAVNYINPKFNFLELKQIWKSSKPLFFNLQNKTNKIYLPFFNSQILIISQKLFDIIKNVQSDITCRPLILADTEKNIVKLYYFIEPKKIDCLGDNLSYKKDGSVEKIILSKKKIQDNKVFKIKGISYTHLVVDLEVVEKFFQKNINEFEIEELEVNEVL